MDLDAAPSSQYADADWRPQSFAPCHFRAARGKPMATIGQK
jgi:hypothetical protein